MKHAVIIDCDPGTDDTIALVMALASEALDVKAVTTVAGNQTADKTALNGLKIVSYLKKEIPVAKGADKPIMRPLVTAEHVHGETGLGPVTLPEPSIEGLDTPAWDLFYQLSAAKNEKIHLITLGPLSNVAIALMKYPQLRDYITHITMMGGSMGYGNDTPAAEYNIYADPEAARMVFEAGIPITMVGLDCTHQAWLTREEIDTIEAPEGSGAWLAKAMMNHIHAFATNYGFPGAVMHDPSAVAAVIDPTLIETKDYYVAVETKGKHTTGKTVVDVMGVTKKPANVAVAVGIDRERFVQLVQELMKA
ncbi:nucleoside hydrolase [Anoxynatronum sibiricum]|uniref:Nucleoside hydrolase n=1 Tax=Anoxynatronum sibiricum TaxID=210623 RepID=A0ABU9VS04_9CLOT